MEPRVSSFDDAAYALGWVLANAYEDVGEFGDAAKVLRDKVVPNLGTRKPTDKVATYLELADLLLSDDDHGKAEDYIQRASQLMHDPEVKAKPDLETHHMSIRTKIQDCQRKFEQAANGYIKLSWMAVDEDEINRWNEMNAALKGAMICAVLAKAGTQRSRILATLYKDERCRGLQEWSMLEASHLGKLIGQSAKDAFEARLEPHHAATDQNGFTTLESAMIYHNLQAASKIYVRRGFF